MGAGNACLIKLERTMGGRVMLQPQEVEVFYVLPAIRRALAKAMIVQGLSQREVAKRLGLTEGAVSQYMHGKRAKSFPLGAGIRNAVRDSAARITDPLTSVRETQHLLKVAMQDKTTCKMHELLGAVPKNCSICFHHG